MPMPAVAPVERVELVRLFQYGIPRPEHADPTLQVLQVSGGPAPKWGPPSSWEPPLLRIGQETQLEKYLRLQGIEPREGHPCPILELTNLDYNPKVFSPHYSRPEIGSVSAVRLCGISVRRRRWARAAPVLRW